MQLCYYKCIYWFIIATWGSTLLICPLVSLLSSFPLSVFHTVCLSCGVRSLIHIQRWGHLGPSNMHGPACRRVGAKLTARQCLKRTPVSFWVRLQHILHLLLSMHFATHVTFNYFGFVVFVNSQLEMTVVPPSRLTSWAALKHDGTKSAKWQVIS